MQRLARASIHRVLALSRTALAARLQFSNVPRLLPISRMPALRVSPSLHERGICRHMSASTTDTKGPRMTFLDLGVRPRLVRKAGLLGAKSPTPIQEAAIAAAMGLGASAPLLLHAHTGTGKTLAFLLPLLTKLSQTQAAQANPQTRAVKAIIMVPSRELAMQVLTTVLQLVDCHGALDPAAGSAVDTGVGVIDDDSHLGPVSGAVAAAMQTPLWAGLPRDVVVQMAVGGDDLREQVHRLAANPPMILIGTPKRLNMLFNGVPPPPMPGQPVVDVPPLDKVQFFVADEADAMIQSLSAKATIKEIEQRQRHPKPAALFIASVLYRCPKAQLTCVSATINSRLRQEVQRNQWGQTRPVIVRPEAEIESGLGTHASVLTAGSESQGEAHHQQTMFEPESEPRTLPVLTLPASLRHQFVLLPNDSMAAKINMIGRVLRQDRGVTPTSPVRGLLFVTGDVQLLPLVNDIRAQGISCESLYQAVNSSLEERFDFLERVASGETQLIVSTIATARGIDIPGLSHVFLGDQSLMKDERDYLHLAGRTARAGQTGTVVCLLDRDELFRLRKIEMYLKIRFTQLSPADSPAPPPLPAEPIRSVRPRPNYTYTGPVPPVQQEQAEQQQQAQPQAEAKQAQTQVEDTYVDPAYERLKAKAQLWEQPGETVHVHRDAVFDDENSIVGSEAEWESDADQWYEKQEREEELEARETARQQWAAKRGLPPPGPAHARSRSRTETGASRRPAGLSWSDDEGDGRQSSQPEPEYEPKFTAESRLRTPAASTSASAAPQRARYGYGAATTPDAHTSSFAARPGIGIGLDAGAGAGSKAGLDGASEATQWRSARPAVSEAARQQPATATATSRATTVHLSAASLASWTMQYHEPQQAKWRQTSAHAQAGPGSRHRQPVAGQELGQEQGANRAAKRYQERTMHRHQEQSHSERQAERPREWRGKAQTRRGR